MQQFQIYILKQYATALFRKRYYISYYHPQLKTSSTNKETVHTLSALEIAEQMTFLDQKILFAIHSR